MSLSKHTLHHGSTVADRNALVGKLLLVELLMFTLIFEYIFYKKCS